MPEIKIGQPYWIVTDWTSRGMRVEECIWQNDLIDNERFHKKLFHATKSEADYTLKNL